MLINTRDSFGLITRILHWLIAALVIGNLIGGAVLSLFESGGLRTFTLSAHKSTGVIILLLMTGRLIWRLYNSQPRDLGNIPALNFIAYVLHIWLYVLLFLQPLSGILMSQAYGYPVIVFGLFKLPSLIWNSPALGAIFGEVHTVASVVLILTIAIHIAAALKHHFVDRDNTLMRMLKGK
ncbi:cytochrome b561 [Desulfosarcina variabilis str. Montpellier]|uniref:cytochrome b n=1 Tax=Desulfosarcina variabilis TaxID=2300 RepID=UPI003AFB201A